jgi:hypothetical protein
VRRGALVLFTISRISYNLLEAKWLEGRDARNTLVLGHDLPARRGLARHEGTGRVQCNGPRRLNNIVDPLYRASVTLCILITEPLDLNHVHTSKVKGSKEPLDIPRTLDLGEAYNLRAHLILWVVYPHGSAMP